MCNEKLGCDSSTDKAGTDDLAKKGTDDLKGEDLDIDVRRGAQKYVIAT